MAAFKESSRLASVQKHLHGMVCDGAHLWADQCWRNGHLHLRHSLSMRLNPEQGRRKSLLRCAPREVGRPKYIAYLKQTPLDEKGKNRTVCKGLVILACGSWLYHFQPKICFLFHLSLVTSSRNLAFLCSDLLYHISSFYS